MSQSTPSVMMPRNPRPATASQMESLKSISVLRNTFGRKPKVDSIASRCLTICSRISVLPSSQRAASEWCRSRRTARRGRCGRFLGGCRRLGRVATRLLEERSAQTERDLEGVVAQHVAKEARRGQVALVRDLAKNPRVELEVEVMAFELVGREDERIVAVLGASQSKGLVCEEVERGRVHRRAQPSSRLARAHTEREHARERR